MKCDADEAGLTKHWDPGPSKGPPMSFVLPQNKMVEEDDTPPTDKHMKIQSGFQPVLTPHEKLWTKDRSVPVTFGE